MLENILLRLYSSSLSVCDSSEEYARGTTHVSYSRRFYIMDAFGPFVNRCLLLPRTSGLEFLLSDSVGSLLLNQSGVDGDLATSIEDFCFDE